MTEGEKLQEVMQWRGVTQRELSNRTGIARSTIGNYITGIRDMQVGALKTIAAALDVSPWTLINGEPLPADPLELGSTENRILIELRSMPLSVQKVLVATIDGMYKAEVKPE